MFRISSILTCAALTLSLGAAMSGPAAAQAQSVTVNIPFSFSANDQKVPAGIYRISLQAPGYPSFVATQSTRKQYLMLVHPLGSKTVRMGAALRFGGMETATIFTRSGCRAGVRGGSSYAAGLSRRRCGG